MRTIDIGHIFEVPILDHTVPVPRTFYEPQ